MVERSPDPSKPVLAIGRQTFSPQQLFDEARMGTETGRAYMESLQKTLLEEGAEPLKETEFQAGGVIE